MENKLNRKLVEIAWQRAEKYEEQGNEKKVQYYLELADKVNKVYGKIEKGEIDILKNRE